MLLFGFIKKLFIMRLFPDKRKKTNLNGNNYNKKQGNRKKKPRPYTCQI